MGIYHNHQSLSVLFIRKSHHNYFLANSTTIGGDVVVGAAISGLLVGAGGAISVALCIDCYRKKKKVYS